MKHDYLWDKTGEDLEIQRLENALSAFRYQETAPPALTAKILPFPAINTKKIPRRRFSFALPLAFAACAASVLILFSVLFQDSKDNSAAAGDSAKTITFRNEDAIRKDSVIAQPQVLSTENFENIESGKQPKRFAARNAAGNSRAIPIVQKQSKPTGKNAETKKSPVMLTAEEKQAYDQLMLALSITGSKLKIVKDKIDGTEEQNEALIIDKKNGRQ